MTILWKYGLWAAALLAISAGSALAATGPSAPDAVVAIVGGRTITRDQVQRRLETLPPQQKKQILLDARPLLRQMIQEELLMQAAEAEKVEAEPAVVASLAQARRGILVNELLRRKIMAAVAVADEELQKFYEANQDRFVEEWVVASHIMVRTEAEAQKVLEDLKAGKDFAALARERSVDAGSVPRGGDLGILPRGATPKAFEDAVFKLKAGELSPVVKTEHGYHVIHVREHVSGPKAFGQVKEQIREHLLTERRQAAFLGYIGDLEKASSVKVFEDRLK